MTRPILSDQLCEAMAAVIPDHGWLVFEVDGVAVQPRELVQLTRVFNSTMVDFGLTDQKVRFWKSDRLGYGRVVLYYNQHGPDFMMCYNIGSMSVGSTLTWQPHPSPIMPRIE